MTSNRHLTTETNNNGNNKSRYRPLLDLPLGFALWRDRGVPSSIKRRALRNAAFTVSALVAAGMATASDDAFGATGQWMIVEGMAWLAGVVLLSALFLLQASPLSSVNKRRFERFQPIPLRLRPASVQEVAEHSDRLSHGSGGVYPIIPCRYR